MFATRQACKINQKVNLSNENNETSRGSHQIHLKIITEVHLGNISG